MIKPKPTKRAVIDVGRKCNINCKFCYHKHLGDLTKQSFLPFEVLRDEIDKAQSRDNTYLDFTGGEPTIHPDICKLVEYAYVKYNMKSCIITNGLCGKNTLNKLVDSKVDSFLVSVEGKPEIHNLLTTKNASNLQDNFFKELNDLRFQKNHNIELRINTVINSYNQGQYLEFIKSLLNRVDNISIVNFINFNPHHGWKNDISETKKTIADLHKTKENLQEAIDHLWCNKIAVNLRYFPMCCIDEDYRVCVCNDLHVLFDPYEWDYGMTPKTPEVYLQHGQTMSNNIELKSYPCSECDLRFICGGINKYFYEAIDGNIQPIKDSNIEDKYYFYHYRQLNDVCLIGRN